MALDKLSEGTRKSYNLGWRWRCLFCRARNVDPVRVVTSDIRQAEESRLLDFVVHLAKHGHKSVGTIKQYLSAVRAQHVALGLPDTTASMARLWMAIEGLKKRQGVRSESVPSLLACYGGSSVVLT